MADASESILSVLVPVEITPAMLVSTTVPENDYLAHNSGTTYGVGDRCISTTTHRVYESLRAGNTNKDPTDVNNRNGATPWWLDLSPTNRWKAFDDQTTTQTSGATPLTYVFKPGSINSIFLGKIDAEHLSITIKDATGGTIVWSYSGDLENSFPPDYYEYFFDPFRPQTEFYADDIPPYANCEVTVTLTRTSGNCLVGIIAVGDTRPLGVTQWGAKAKPKSYSYIKTDDFGNTAIKKRKAGATDMTASAYIDDDEGNYVLQTIQDLLDVPCVWIGTKIPIYGGLRCYGLGSAILSYDAYNNTVLNLDVAGMI